MIVVADSSPLHLLIEINSVEVLCALFKEVIVPTEVAGELSRPTTPQSVRDFIAAPPSWLVICAPNQVLPIDRLHPGEQAAISLAIELNADLLRMDERLGRRAAAERDLSVIGSLGVLERAARRGLIDLREAVKRIRNTGFYVSEQLLEQILHRNRDFI